MKKNKILKIIIILLILLGFFFVIKKTKAKNKKIKRQETVQKKEIIEKISASGETKAEKSVKLRFIAPSKIVWLGVEEGDKVKKYQAIVSVDQRELQKNLEKTLLAYKINKWDYDQLDDDYDVHGRNIDEVPLTDAQKRTLEKALFRTQMSVIDVELANIAKQNATLVSPIDGVVIDIQGFKQGVNLTPSDVATSYVHIIDPNTLKFYANIDEIDYSKLFIGQEAIITLDAYPDKSFEGEITYIAKKGFKTLNGGIVIPVRVSFKNKPDNLIENLSGDVDIIVNKKENTIVINKEFIKNKNGKKIVYKLTPDNEIKEQEITTGIDNITEVEVTSGLNEGDTIVLIENEEK